jgi:exonuclease III
MFGFLNVRSINTKIEDVLELIRDRKIDVGGFAETWHDDESVAINRLRAAGFHVIDRPRPRISNDMLTNHGGVAIVFHRATSADHSPRPKFVRARLCAGLVWPMYLRRRRSLPTWCCTCPARILR